MQKLAEIAAAKIEVFKNNKTIMSFVEQEALEKVAEEIRAKTGSSTTAKAVALLICKKKNANLKKRVDDYVQLGLIGCYLKSIELTGGCLYVGK